MQRGPLVFLIDDDPDDQEIFSMVVAKVYPSAKCVCADNGVSALEMLRNEDTPVPGIIFVDMNMPLIDGMECLAELRKMERTMHVPVYMYSTSAAPRMIEDCKRLGATGFLKKEPDIKWLGEKITQIFHNLEKTLSVDGERG